MDRIGKQIADIIRRNAEQAAQPTRTVRVPAPPPLIPTGIGQQVQQAAVQTYAPPQQAFNLGQVAAQAVAPAPKYNIPEPPRVGINMGELARTAMPDITPQAITGMTVGAPGFAMPRVEEAVTRTTRTTRQEEDEWGVYDVDGVNVAMPTRIAGLNDFNLVSARTTSNPDEVDKLENNHISYRNMPEEVTSKIKMPPNANPFGQMVREQAKQLKKEIWKARLPEKAQALEQFATTAVAEGVKQGVTVNTPEWQEANEFVIIKNADSGETYLMNRQEWNARRENRERGEQQTGQPHMERVMTRNVSAEERDRMIEAGVLNPDTMIIGQNRTVADSTQETTVLDALSLEDAARMQAERASRIGADIVVIDGKEYPAGTKTPPTITVNPVNVNAADLPAPPQGYVWVMDAPSNFIGITGTIDALMPGITLYTIDAKPYLVPETRNREGEIVVGPNQTVLNHPDGYTPNIIEHDTVANVVGVGAKGANWLFSEGIGEAVGLLSSGGSKIIPKPVREGYDKYVRDPATEWITENMAPGVAREVLLAMVDNPITGVLVMAGAPQKANIKNMTLVSLYPDDTGVLRDGGAMLMRNMPGVNWYMDWVESDPDTVRFIYENGYDSDGDGENDIFGIDAVQEYWHLEVLDDDPWGESKWLTFQLFSDPLAYAGAGAVGGRSLRNRGVQIQMSPRASTAKVRTGRVIEGTGKVIEVTSRTIEGVGDLGLEYIANFGAAALRRTTITKPVSSEVRNEKMAQAEGVAVSVPQREAGGAGPAGTGGPATVTISPTGTVTPGPVTRTTRPATGSPTTPPPAAPTVTAPRPTPAPTPSGTSASIIVYGPTARPVTAVPGKGGGMEIVEVGPTPDTTVRIPSSGVEFDTGVGLIPGRWLRDITRTGNRRKIDTVRLSTYRALWKEMHPLWTDSVNRQRDLGSGDVTIRHNNESHRIALLTNAAIKRIDPTDTLPWEFNRYKKYAHPFANEVFVRMPWADSIQQREFLAGVGPMEFRGMVTHPGGPSLLVGPVPVDATPTQLLAYNNAVDSTYYHVKWQGTEAFANAEFRTWFLDAVKTDVDLRAIGERTLDPYTPPPLWEMSEIPADFTGPVSDVVAAPTTAPAAEPTVAPDPATVAAGAPVPAPPAGTTPTAPGRVTPTIPEPKVAEPAPTVDHDAVLAENGIARITDESDIDLDTGEETTLYRYDFLDDGSAYAKGAPTRYGLVPREWRKRYDGQKGKGWHWGTVSDGTRDVDVYAPNEVELINVSIATAKREGWLPESHPGGIVTVDLTTRSPIDIRNVREFTPGMKPGQVLKNGTIGKPRKGSKIRAIPGNLKNAGDTVEWHPDRGGDIIVERVVEQGRIFFVAHTAAGDIYFRGTGRHGFHVLDSEAPILDGKWQDIPHLNRTKRGVDDVFDVGIEPATMVDYIYTQHTDAFDATAGVADADITATPGDPGTAAAVATEPEATLWPDSEGIAPPAEQPTLDGGIDATPDGAVQVADVPEPATTTAADVSQETIAPEPPLTDLAEPAVAAGMVRGRRTRPAVRNSAVAKHRSNLQNRRRQQVVETLTPDERNADLPAGVARNDRYQTVKPETLHTMPEVFQPRKAMNDEGFKTIAEAWDAERQAPIDVTVIDGKYVVYAGHHRLEAALYRQNVLGIPTEVDIRVHDWGDDATNMRRAQELADFDNISRTVQSPLDNAGVVRRAVQRGDDYKTIKSKMNNITEADVIRLDKINDLPNGLQTALGDNWDMQAGSYRNQNLLTLRKAAAIADEISAGRLSSEGAFNFYIENIVNDPMPDAQFIHWLGVREQQFKALNFDAFFADLDMGQRPAVEALLDEVSRTSAKEMRKLESEAKALARPAESGRLQAGSKKDLAANAKKAAKEAKDAQAALDRAQKDIIKKYNEAQRTGAVFSGGGKQNIMDLSAPAADAPATRVVQTEAGLQNQMDLGPAATDNLSAEDMLRAQEIPTEPVELTPEQIRQNQLAAGQVDMFGGMFDTTPATQTATQIIDNDVQAKMQAFEKASVGTVHKSDTYTHDDPVFVKTGETVPDPTGTIEVPVYERANADADWIDPTPEEVAEARAAAMHLYREQEAVDRARRDANRAAYEATLPTEPIRTVAKKDFKHGDDVIAIDPDTGRPKSYYVQGAGKDGVRAADLFADGGPVRTIPYDEVIAANYSGVVPDMPQIPDSVLRELGDTSPEGRGLPTGQELRLVRDLEAKYIGDYMRARRQAMGEIAVLDDAIESMLRGKAIRNDSLIIKHARTRSLLTSLIEEGDIRHSPNGLSPAGEKIVNDIFDDPNTHLVTIPGGVFLSRLATKATHKVQAKLVVDTTHAERTGYVQATHGVDTWMHHPIEVDEVHILTEIPFADGTTVMSRVEAEYTALGNKDGWKSPVTVYEQHAIRTVLGEYEARLLEVYPDGMLPNWAKAQIKKLPPQVQGALERVAQVLRNIVGARDRYLQYRRQRMLTRRDRMITYPATQYIGNSILTVFGGMPRGIFSLADPRRAAEIRRVQEGKLPGAWEPQLDITPAQQMYNHLGMRPAPEILDVYKGRQLGDAQTTLIGERTIRKVLPGKAGDAGAWLWGSNKGGSKTVLRAAAGDINYRDFVARTKTMEYMKNDVIPDYRNQTINYLIDNVGMTKEIATREWNYFVGRNRNWEFSYNDVNNHFKTVTGVTPGQAERLARNWQQAMNETQKRVRADIRRTTFASPTTRADLVLQRVLMFHYFQSRQTWFLAQQSLKHPFLLNLYANVYESLQDAADEWPTFLQGWVKLMGDGVFGRAIFFNPVALLSTYLMFNDRGTIWEFGKERDTNPGDLKWWMDTFGFSPDINDITNLIGMQGDTWAPDVLGVGYESNLITMALNWGRAHGYIGDDPRPIGDYYRDAQIMARHYFSGFVQDEPIEARSSKASFDREITAIAYDEARKDGLDPDNPNDKAMIDYLLADPDSDLYRRSVKRWVNGEMAEIGIRAIAQPFRPRFRLTNEQGKDLMTNLSEAERRAVNTADPRVRIFRNQQDGYYKIGSKREQMLVDTWSEIVQGEGHGDITVNGITYTEDEIQAMTVEQRIALANGLMAEYGVMDDINRVRDEREKFNAQPENAEYATYKRWQKAVFDYEGGPEGYWEALRAENPSAQFYWDHVIMKADSEEERNRLMTGNNAYFSILGYHVSVWDQPPPSFDNRGEAFDPVNIVNQAPAPTPYTESNAEFKAEVRTVPEFAAEMEDWDAAVNAKRAEFGWDTSVPFSQLSYKDRKLVEDALSEDGVYEPKPTWQQQLYIDWAEKKLAANPKADVSMEAYFAEDQESYYKNMPANTDKEINKTLPVAGPDKYGNTPVSSTTNGEFWMELLDLINTHDHTRYPKD